MRIAIAGGMGSGKSEVLRVAGEMGLKALDADEINARLMSSAEYLAKLEELFPDAFVDGQLDKRRLADIVFSDEAQRKKLNALAHPIILREIAEEKAPIVVAEVPLLHEAGAESLFDKVILVHTPLSLRLMRLKKYRGVTFSDALKRIRRQTPYRKLRQGADVVLKNGGDLMKLRFAAKQVFEECLRDNLR